MNNNKILCIGDSLSLPGHLNKYEDTWYYILKNEFPTYDFISFFKRALTTEALVTMGGGKGSIDKWPSGSDALEAYMPNIVIIQLGIVDCAPRLFNKYEKKIIYKLGDNFLNKYIKISKKLRKRTNKNAFVSPRKFFSNLKEYLERCKKINVKKVIFIAICYPDKRIILKNKEIIKYVEQYNSIIKSLAEVYPFVEVISPLNPRNHNESIYEDGYHCNYIGHRIVANSVICALKQLNITKCE